MSDNATCGVSIPSGSTCSNSSSAAPPQSQASSGAYRHSLSVDDDSLHWTALPTAATSSYGHQGVYQDVAGGTSNSSNVTPPRGGGHHPPIVPPASHTFGELVVPVDDTHVGLLNMVNPPPGARRAKTTQPRHSGSSAGSGITTTRRRCQPTDNDAESTATVDSSLSALELRRKRNRESMQRTRVREREEVDKMREALVVMEKEYTQALQLQSQQQSNPVLSEYYSLSSESKQLKRENFLLRQNLERRRKAYERTERILADYHIEKTEIDMDDLEDEEAVNSASAVFGIAPITEDEAFALITRCSQAVQRLERTTLNVTMESESRCFGWNVRRKIIGDSDVHFLFTKTYLNLDPERVANRAWDIYKTSEKNNMKPIRVLRFETLQVVNENTHVMARDIVHPRHKGVVMRSVFLRFRMQTDTGFVVGRSCMNPTPGSAAASPHGSDQHAGIRFADLSTWLEVTYLDPQRRDQVGCEVKFGGYCDYKTTHDLNERFMDVLFSVVQMENRLLEPLVPLLI